MIPKLRPVNRFKAFLLFYVLILALAFVSEAVDMGMPIDIIELCLAINTILLSIFCGNRAWTYWRRGNGIRYAFILFFLLFGLFGISLGYESLRPLFG